MKIWILTTMLVTHGCFQTKIERETRAFQSEERCNAELTKTLVKEAWDITAQGRCISVDALLAENKPNE